MMTMKRTDWRTYDYSEGPARAMTSMRLRPLGNSLHSAARTSSDERHASAPPTRTLSKSPTRPASSVSPAYLLPMGPKTSASSLTRSPRKTSAQKPLVTNLIDSFQLTPSNVSCNPDYDTPSLIGNSDSRDADSDAWNDIMSRNRSQQRARQTRDSAENNSHSRELSVGFYSCSGELTPLRGRNQSSGQLLLSRGSSNTPTVHTSNQRSKGSETITPRIVTPTTQAEAAHNRVDYNHRSTWSYDVQDDPTQESATSFARMPPSPSLLPKVNAALPAFEDEEPFDVCSNGSRFPACRRNLRFRHCGDEPFDEIETDAETANHSNDFQTWNKNEGLLTPSSTQFNATLLLPSLATPPSPCALMPPKHSLEQKHQTFASKFQPADQQQPSCVELTSLPSPSNANIVDRLEFQPDPQRGYINDDDSDSESCKSRPRSLPPRLHNSSPLEDSFCATRHRAASQSSLLDAASHSSETIGAASPASSYDAALHASITNGYNNAISLPTSTHSSAFESSSLFDSKTKSTNPFNFLSSFTGHSVSGSLYNEAYSHNVVESNVETYTCQPKLTVPIPLVNSPLPSFLDELQTAQRSVERVISNETLSTMGTCLNPYVKADDGDDNDKNRVWSKSTQITDGIGHEIDIADSSIHFTRQDRTDKIEDDVLRWRQAEKQWKRAEASHLEYPADDDDYAAEEEIIPNCDSYAVQPVVLDAVGTSAGIGRRWSSLDRNKDGACREQDPLSLGEQSVAIMPAVDIREDASTGVSSFMRSNGSNASKTGDLSGNGPTSILRIGRYDGSGALSDSGVSRRSHPWDKVGISGSKSDNEESLDSVFDFSDVDEQKKESVISSAAVSPKMVAISKLKGEVAIDRNKSRLGLNSEGERELDEGSIKNRIRSTSKKEKGNNFHTRGKQERSARNKPASIASRGSYSEDRSDTRRDSKSADKEKDSDSFVASARDKKDAAHKFAPRLKKKVQDDDTAEYTEFTDDGTNYTDDNTIEGRSLNSAYTKSTESEVEDIIKDLLFIGRGEANNPGKRQLKYKKGLKDYSDTSTEKSIAMSRKASLDVERSSVKRGRTLSRGFEDASAEQSVSEDKSKSLRKGEKKEKRKIEKKERRKSEKKERQKSDEDSVDLSTVSSVADAEPDPLSFVWDYMEGGFTAMSSAFGLSSKNVENQKKNLKSKRQVESRPDPSAKMAKRPMSPKKKSKDAKVQATSLVRPRRGDDYKSEMSTLETDYDLSDGKPPLHSWLEYASNLIFARGEPKDDSTSGSVDDEETLDGTIDDTLDDTYDEILETKIVDNESKLDKTAGLLKLALGATRNKHLTYGVAFDESVKIDVLNDIKFIVLTVALPLGLMFQENAAGCWVIRVLKSGNVACSTTLQGEGVEVGDQLAAINGTSAVYKKGSEVGKMISIAANPLKIELSFVRYVGPLRPSKNTLEQEGYEVSDSIEELDPIIPPAANSQTGGVASQKSFGGIDSERLKKFKKTRCWEKADIASLSYEPASFKYATKTPVSFAPLDVSIMTKAGSPVQALRTTTLSVQTAQNVPLPVSSSPPQAKQQKAKSVAPLPVKSKLVTAPPAEVKQQEAPPLIQPPSKEAVTKLPPALRTPTWSLLMKHPQMPTDHQPASVEATKVKKKFGFFKIGKKNNQR